METPAQHGTHAAQARPVNIKFVERILKVDEEIAVAVHYTPFRTIRIEVRRIGFF